MYYARTPTWQPMQGDVDPFPELALETVVPGDAATREPVTALTRPIEALCRKTVERGEDPPERTPAATARRS
jgi:hypothetical protein